MNENVILEARNLKKIYNLHSSNAFEALHGINLQVKEGEFVVIMGPSGSGKTTLINTISTIDLPTSGSVLIHGKDVRTMSANELGHFRYHHLGFIFQDFNLLQINTVYQNIAMPLKLAHVRNRDIRKRVYELARQMKIEDQLKKYPDQCSGGQRQRGAICRALIHHPNIIVADEPTGNLDCANSAELLEIFRKLNETEQVTIVMVTHDPLAASYSSRMIYLQDGMIDSVLERGQMSRDDYFQQIVAINAAQSMQILQKNTKNT